MGALRGARYSCFMRIPTSLIVLAAAACRLPSEPDHSFGHPELPEARGTQVAVTSLVYGGPLAWSAAGDEIYFAAMSADGPQAGYALKAVTLEGLASRELATSTKSMHRIAGGADGASVLYSVFPTIIDSGPVLRRISDAGGAPSLLASNIGWGLAGTSTSTSSFVELSNGDVAYLQFRTTLAVKPAAGEPRMVASNCQGIVAVSPSRDAVVCTSFAASRAILMRVDLASGATDTLPVGANVAEYLDLVHWGADGIRIVYRNGLDKHLFTVATGASRTILVDSLADLSAGYDFGTFAMSPDGGTLAYWRWECTRSTGILSCDSQLILTLMRLADLTTRQVAVVKRFSNQDITLGVPMFSPDGTRVAYHVYGRIYVVNTTP